MLNRIATVAGSFLKNFLGVTVADCDRHELLKIKLPKRKLVLINFLKCGILQYQNPTFNVILTKPSEKTTFIKHIGSSYFCGWVHSKGPVSGYYTSANVN